MKEPANVSTAPDWHVAFVVLLWLPVAWINLEPFRGAHMDTCCLLGPAAFASGPLALTLPMMGDWLHADQSWGIHWPGSPLLLSFILPWFETETMRVTAVVFLVLWLLVAEVTRRLTVHATGSYAWGLVAMVVIFTDRLIYENAATHRPEMLSILVLLATLTLFYRRFGSKQRAQAWVMPLLLVCLFLLPVMHPVLLLLGAVAGVGILWMLVAEQEDRPALLACAVALLLGACFLPVWLVSHPGALAQFMDHANHNAGAPWEGPQLLAVAVAYGLGVHTPLAILALLVVLLGFAEGVRVWAERLGFAVREADDGVPAWRAIFKAVPHLLRHDPTAGYAAVVVMGLPITQRFHNFFYYVVLSPLVIVLALTLLHRLMTLLRGRAYRAAVVVGLCLLVVQASILLQRTVAYVRAGYPDIPAKVAAFAQGLPPEGKVVVSYSLWEIGLLLPERDVRLLTPSYKVSPALRREYEHRTWMALEPGDLVLLDRHKQGQYRWILDQYGEWEEVGDYVHPMPDYDEYRFDFVVLQLVRLYAKAPLSPIDYRQYD